MEVLICFFMVSWKNLYIGSYFIHRQLKLTLFGIFSQRCLVVMPPLSFYSTESGFMLNIWQILCSCVLANSDSSFRCWLLMRSFNTSASKATLSFFSWARQQERDEDVGMMSRSVDTSTAEMTLFVALIRIWPSGDQCWASSAWPPSERVDQESQGKQCPLSNMGKKWKKSYCRY